MYRPQCIEVVNATKSDVEGTPKVIYCGRMPLTCGVETGAKNSPSAFTHAVILFISPRSTAAN